MSVEDVKRFIAKAQDDHALQDRLNAIDCQFTDEGLAEVVEVAADAGFAFTAEQYDDASMILASEPEVSDEAADEPAEGAGYAALKASDGRRLKWPWEWFKKP